MKTIVHLDIRGQVLQSFNLPRYEVEDYSFTNGIQNGFLSTKKLQSVGSPFLNPTKLFC